MIIGFTGTREGMSTSQENQLRYVLAVFRQSDRHIGRQTMFMDGACPRGADKQARDLAITAGLVPDPRPPKAWTAKELLARDLVIAKECDVLVAAPRADAEERRSGTWATVRYARKAGKPVVMLSR